REREVDRVVERLLLETRLENLERIVDREVRRQRDFAERLLAVGAGNREHAIRELDVAVARFQHVRRDLLAFDDHFVSGFGERRATDRRRPRAVRAEPELDLVGIAEHDLDVLARDAELARYDLRARRLVTLAVVVRAHQHGHVTGRMNAHGGALEQAAAHAEPDRDARWRQPARFDVRAQPDTAILAAALRFLFALREAGPVRGRERAVEAT